MYGSVCICLYRLLREIYALSTQGDNIHVVRVANACQHSHAKSHTDKSIIQELTFACMPARFHKHTHTHTLRARTHTNTSIQVRYFNAWEQEDKLYIQMELCKGSLADLRKKQGPLAEPQLSDIMVQVACPSWLCHGLIAHTPFHPPVSQPATAL